MKTQLLEDFDESGSAPSRAAGVPAAQPAQATAPAAQAAAPAVPSTVPAAQSTAPAAQAVTPAPLAAAPAERPAAPSRPAVWQRPRQAEAATASASPVAAQADAAAQAHAAVPSPAAAAASPASVRPHPAAPRQTVPGQPLSSPPPPPSPPRQAPIHPRGFALQPTASGTTTVPLGDTTAPAWPQGPSSGGDPDWLTERLARDAALQERTEWNGLWRRRLASWGAAGVLLALLAGGGLWLYEQSRVEGALVVVANTNPAPEAHTPRPVGMPAPAVVPASPPVAAIDTSGAAAASVQGAEPSVPAAASGTVESAGEGATGGTAGPSTAAGSAEPQTPAFADRSVVPVATDAPPPAKPKHKRVRATRHAEPEARADIREGERSYRQRYEETLMQCRAHGYDERQCLQRGCEMTRYGFACKG